MKPVLYQQPDPAESDDEADAVVRRFTHAMLHSLVGTFGIPTLVTPDSEEPGEIPMEQLIAECCQSVPRLLPHCGRFDEYPAGDALAVQQPRLDFVAHTAHMKKIFKLLHSKAAVELMVHRVGGTIVLDGVLDHQLDSWAVQGDEWTVVEEQSLESPEDQLPQSAQPVLQGSPFLYFDSADEAEAEEREPDECEIGLYGEAAAVETRSSSAVQAASRFRRVFRWQFKELDMLLASHHMIWSSEEYPALSLRLHNAEQELGSMSCLDYWLDNTMASIDNIGLCYHRDGTMQGYEIIQTGELPSKARRLGFSPEAVMTHAHSVLRFLQTHCERDGGTYLLSRDQDSHRLELYEVTECLSQQNVPEEQSDAEPAPASLPRPLARKVALLCGRMAKNISSQVRARLLPGCSARMWQEHPTESELSRCRRLYQRCANLLQPQADWLLWAGSIEGAGNTFVSPGSTEHLIGLCGGSLFPDGCPNIMTVDCRAERLSAELSEHESTKFLAAGGVVGLGWLTAGRRRAVCCGAS